jgi:GNAT superfamily N-acetyltransferase
MRVSFGWGAVSKSDWPDSPGTHEWPPSEPPGLDEKAKPNRIARYQRIHDSLECKYALVNWDWGPVQASFEITSQWFSAEKGIIEMPREGEELVGSHAVLITGYSDEEGMFKFVNSWGEEWGDSGCGKLPYEYFDSLMLDVYISDHRRRQLPPMPPTPIAEMQWGGRDFAGRVFHVHEFYDWKSNERIAWAFAMLDEGFLDVEELYVRPQYRGRDFGTRMLESLHKLSKMSQLPLRLFIPYADCGPDNLKTAQKLLAKKGYFLITSGLRWAPFIALAQGKLEDVHIPPPPALVRPKGDTLAALMPPFGEVSADDISLSTDADGTGNTNPEPGFKRLITTNNSQEGNGNAPWLVVLSDWSKRPWKELFDRIAQIFREPHEQVLVPTVIIVDDLDNSLADHETLLTELTRAGGIVLVPQTDEEVETIQREPVAFAARQLVVAMQAQPSGVGTLPLSGPSFPHGYKEFAKPVTRLSPGALQDIIEGRRSDDWRYSI